MGIVSYMLLNFKDYSRSLEAWAQLYVRVLQAEMRGKDPASEDLALIHSAMDRYNPKSGHHADIRKKPPPLEKLEKTEKPQSPNKATQEVVACSSDTQAETVVLRCAGTLSESREVHVIITQIERGTEPVGTASISTGIASIKAHGGRSDSVFYMSLKITPDIPSIYSVS